MPKLVRIPVYLNLKASEVGVDILPDSDLNSDGSSIKLVQVCDLLSARLDKSAFDLDIDDFDGPIDLLLHLVKRNELPIEKLSLAKVADQFFSCVKQAEMHDLEIAGEYLVIAANLLSIKASLLVDPKSQIEIESDEGPDPHAELLQRLREAAVYQQIAQEIASRNLLGVDVFAANLKDNLSKIASPAEEPLAKHDMNLLLKAWNRVLQKMPVQRPQMVINWARVSVTEKMQIFVEKLNSAPQKRFLFQELLEATDDLPHLVSSFVAVLELCKRQLVTISQGSFQDDIFISLKVENADKTESTFERSEFDQPVAELAGNSDSIGGSANKLSGNL